MSNEAVSQTPPPAPASTESDGDNQTKLTEVDVSNENVALNVMVGFLNLAQRRGAFTLDESAKIWECICQFRKNEPANQKINAE